MVSARNTAAKILLRALEGGAFAAAALDAELARNLDLDVRDRALVTELVFGTLRYRVGLLEVLKKSVKKVPEGNVQAHLLIAMYQLAFLDRVPGFAAVNEAVESVRGHKGQQVAGFVNAVLRGFARDLETRRDVLRSHIADKSLPRWAAERLKASVGPEHARSLYQGGAPPLSLCVRAVDERDAILSMLRAARPTATFTASELSPLGILVEDGGDLSALPGHDTQWIIQELGSQLIAQAVAPKSGERILDACSGRGNKVFTLKANACEAVVHATDLHPAKLDVALRRGADAVFAVDWTVGSGAVMEQYDAVLVDAPCSGFGTLRRRPDILLRRSEADLAELATIQRAILAQASRHVAPGGRLVYAVCSVLREEAEAVIATASPLFSLASEMRLLPNTHGTDGYYLALLHRVR